MYLSHVCSLYLEKRIFLVTGLSVFWQYFAETLNRFFWVSTEVVHKCVSSTKEKSPHTARCRSGNLSLMSSFAMSCLKVWNLLVRKLFFLKKKKKTSNFMLKLMMFLHFCWDPICCVTAHVQTIKAGMYFWGAAYPWTPLGSFRGKPSIQTNLCIHDNTASAFY